MASIDFRLFLFIYMKHSSFAKLRCDPFLVAFKQESTDNNNALFDICTC